MKKINKKINNKTLNEIVAKSVKSVLNEVIVDELPEEEQNQIVFENVMDTCKNIILNTQYAGRMFNRRNEKRYAELDPEFGQMKEELIESIRACFENAKQLMRYCHDKSTNDYQRGQASRYFDKEFTPEW